MKQKFNVNEICDGIYECNNRQQFDEMMTRNRIYSDFERHKHEETCNLFSKEVK